MGFGRHGRQGWAWMGRRRTSWRRAPQLLPMLRCSTSSASHFRSLPCRATTASLAYLSSGRRLGVETMIRNRKRRNDTEIAPANSACKTNSALPSLPDIQQQYHVCKASKARRSGARREGRDCGCGVSNREVSKTHEREGRTGDRRQVWGRLPYLSAGQHCPWMPSCAPVIFPCFLACCSTHASGKERTWMENHLIRQERRELKAGSLRCIHAVIAFGVPELSCAALRCWMQCDAGTHLT
ncbi:hypothetical protein CCHR01_02646 [Colletotrichum chrysophilum]|uniref:Uncharacterized protein n=1 Tax=Colletotrichum chrysophilum TaxID=1836956 RepID=A0AAD9AWN1_9PEZI|nr:hypothetical protein CCHR01_02646 [Colletotrichum chrysophilum]